GLDTIVLTNGKIIEKPTSLEEARQNIIESSSNYSKVITGISIINLITNETINTFQETKIYFKKINNCDVDFYLNNEPDIMYASGFIIENIASNFIEKIEGSYYNILGAPVEKIYEILNTMDIYLNDIN
ncbi:MAG: Maf family protein, partial [Bacilli bacterium]|nr:Maf family protein [Bacilli bacterium]